MKGPLGFSDPFLYPALVFIGGYDGVYSASLVDGVPIVTYLMMNTTSVTSAGHGPFNGPNELPSWSRSEPNGGLPFSTVYQMYIWSEVVR